MKTKEEILNSIANINRDEDGMRVYYLWEVMNAMEEWGLIMYNKALKDSLDKLGRYGTLNTTWKAVKDDIESLKI